VWQSTLLADNYVRKVFRGEDGRSKENFVLFTLFFHDIASPLGGRRERIRKGRGKEELIEVAEGCQRVGKVN